MIQVAYPNELLPALDVATCAPLASQLPALPAGPRFGCRACGAHTVVQRPSLSPIACQTCGGVGFDLIG